MSALRPGGATGRLARMSALLLAVTAIAVFHVWSRTRVLAVGGRAAAISFHSLEDRMVKQAFQSLTRTCTCPPGLPVCRCGADPAFRAVTRKAVTASEAEVARNPRSRSAKLRAVVKVR